MEPFSSICFLSSRAQARPEIEYKTDFVIPQKSNTVCEISNSVGTLEATYILSVASYDLDCYNSNVFGSSCTTQSVLQNSTKIYLLKYEAQKATLHAYVIRNPLGRIDIVFGSVSPLWPVRKSV